MIKQIVKKKRTINKNIEATSNRKLSIQFSLDGFSFCISNTQNEVFEFSSFNFSKTVNSPELVLDKLQEIFKTEKSLQEDFESVTVIHQNNLSTLVPNKYFKEDALKNYLKYSVKTIATDLIVYDELECIDTKNVYIPFVNINNFLFQNFGEFEYRHHLTLFIEKLISINNSDKKVVYVNVSSEIFDIVVIQNKQLCFSNSFSFETKEDFIYYILFTFEQLKLDVEEIQLYFTGDIELESELYNITYQYIRNVLFLESNNSIFKQLNCSKHSNYILLGS